MSDQNDSAAILDSVKSDLLTMDELPIGEHAEHLESVHRTLEAALSTVDGL